MIVTWLKGHVASTNKNKPIGKLIKNVQTHIKMNRKTVTQNKLQKQTVDKETPTTDLVLLLENC